MVHKIKLTVLFLIAGILSFLAFTHKGNVEVNLVKTLLPKSVTASGDIVNITNKSSSLIKVVFEADSEDELDEIILNFENQIDKDYFEASKPDPKKLIEKYLSQSANFLSDKTKALLKEEKYDEIYANSMNMLYSPAGVQLSTIDKDPYLLFDDFILSNKKISEKDNFDGKFYRAMSLKIKNDEGLSPDLSNKKISELIKIQKKLSKKSAKIYLAGIPVHSYYTSIKSIVSINVICILSTLIIVFLTYYYFRSLKLLICVALSILFGFLTGYCATKLWFSDFQIITMVFSATLIGIGIDYSCHSLFKGKIDKNFVKNLTMSLITTVIPFILLYFTDIELLEQVAVFTIFGLFGIYFAVLMIYSDMDMVLPVKSIKINDKICKIFLVMLVVLGITGFFRLKFNGTLTALYTPSRNLKKAEMLYSKISSDGYENAKILVVEGKDFSQIMEKEERAVSWLFEHNIDYISLSKFLPSKTVQKENFELTKKLYKNNLDKYSDILSKKQMHDLKNSSFKAVEFDLKDYPFLSDFMPANDRSVIFAFADKISMPQNLAKTIDFKGDTENCMKKYAKLLLKFLPLALLVLILALCAPYGFKNALKILTPSILGIITAVGANCLIFGEINLFGIIAVFLAIGFTIDYSIFRNGREKYTEDAVLVSCVTTSLSFLMLSMCGFKLLSSIAVILFFAITVSYLTGKILFLHDKI